MNKRLVALPEGTAPSLLLPDRVLKGKKGHCVGLAVIYLTLAQRLNMPIFAECLPEHLFLRYDNGITAINIETTDKGHANPDSYYYREFLTGAPPFPDVYLRRLTQKEVIGIFLLDLGICFAGSGRDRDALDVWTTALEYCPRHPAILLNLGKMYVKLGDNQHAEQMLLEAAGLDPNGWQAYHGLCATYLATRQVEPAIKSELKAVARIEQAITIRPRELGPLAPTVANPITDKMLEERAAGMLERSDADVTALLILAVIAFDRGKYEPASRLLGRALEVSPNASYLHVCQAASCFRRGMYSQAIQHSKMADAAYGPSGHPRRFSLLFSELIECYRNLSGLYIVQKDYDRGIEMVNKAMEIGGPSTHSYDVLGYAYLYKGDKAKARELFRKALEIDPTYEHSREGLLQAQTPQ